MYYVSTLNAPKQSIFLSICFVIWLLFVSATTTSAATFTVTNTNDSGPGSLRQAVLDADANAGADTIEFDVGGVFATPQIITLASGQIVINDHLSLNGTGAASLTISGNNTSRVFTINQGKTVSLGALTVSNGVSEIGGGIYNYNAGNLTVTDCIIRGNSAFEGGGIFNGGTLTLAKTTVSGNLGNGPGGGIYNSTGWTFTLTNSTVSGNSARYGGGIANAGILDITESVVRDNRTSGATGFCDVEGGDGGGLHNVGQAMIGGSLFSGNRTGDGCDGFFHPDSPVSWDPVNGGHGGAIANWGTLEIRNSTLSGNQTGNGGRLSGEFGAVGGMGAAVYSHGGSVSIFNATINANTLGNWARGSVFKEASGGGSFSITSSLVANTDGQDDIAGIVTSGDFNLVEDPDGTLPGSNNLVGVDPKLGPLADNGGPTPTHALLPGSPAIDAGGPTDLLTDQRGEGFPRVVGPAADIGAFEFATVQYDFTGFFEPIDNDLSVYNVAKAGSAIPIKFSLNGDHGLDILAPGYPLSSVIPCDGTSGENHVEETVNGAGGSSLTYEPATDTYTFVWKTAKPWKGTCRQLNVKLDDGTEHKANFRLK